MYFDYIRSVLNFLDPCPPNIFFYFDFTYERKQESGFLSLAFFT